MNSFIVFLSFRITPIYIGSNFTRSINGWTLNSVLRNVPRFNAYTRVGYRIKYLYMRWVLKQNSLKSTVHDPFTLFKPFFVRGREKKRWDGSWTLVCLV